MLAPVSETPMRRLLILAAALALAACASRHGTREKPIWPHPEAPVVTPPAQPQPQPQPQPEVVPDPSPGVPEAIPPPSAGRPKPPLPNYPRSAEQVSGSAVASLIRQAQQQRTARQPAQAAATLQRALRIEQRNYFAWALLAQTQLDQGLHDLAESSAMKSNSLARGNVYVELENWKTISAARAAQKDSEGAMQAQARVEQLQQLLAPR